MEGTWYCPALPEPLITATTSLRDHAITSDLYDQQITARCPYQLKHKDGPDADGYQRLSCRATGTRPGLICRCARPRAHHERGAKVSSDRLNRRRSAPDIDHHRP